MDSLYYVLLTNLVIFISFVTFIVMVTVHVVKKKKPKVLSYIVLFLCIVGMYLFIPSRYVYQGYAFQSPDLLKKAIKYSINPYEKRLCYLYMSELYSNYLNMELTKDGNKAIKYLEKALNGEYAKYKLETATLALLYSIKGDYKKTTELNEILGTKQGLSLLNVYIINNEYEKAISTFKDNDKSIDNFLKADLYKNVGKLKEAELAKNIAEQTYEHQLNNYKEKSKQMEYIESTKKYRTVEAYKNWLKEQAKEYKF